MKGVVNMPQDRFNLNVRAALLAAIALAYPVIGYCAPAAQVDFAVGNVTVLGANGQSRPLGKGTQIEQGDTVNTNGGRAQLRFTDGAYVSLQPESQFRIDQYRFDGKQDGNEKGFFSLLKGGLRTITGLVGRTNKGNYQVTTSVATIGIRGTEYTIQYGQSITGTVGEGEINVCNGAGCLSVTNGESYYVQNQEVKPVLTNKRTDLPPPEPTQPPSNFTQGDNKDAAGNPVGIILPLTAPIVPLKGTQTLDAVTANFCDCTNPDQQSGVTVVFDSNGNLVRFDSIVPSSVQMAGNDGIVAWGTFVDPSSSRGLKQFVAGIPVPSADLTNLAGTTGTYALIGSTAVMNSSGNAIGTLDRANLTVNFGNSASFSAGMTWTINGLSLSATLLGSGSGSILSSPNNNNNCGSSCSVNASVALFGAGAMRAGMAYGISDSLNNINGIGVAAFAKQ
jgi:hypothetical protein